MYDGPKLLLVDGMNLCCREFFSKKNLTHKGRAVDVLFGVFKSLISYHKRWPEHFRIVAWEGGYTRRLQESEEGVASGIIPETYKQNRREKKDDPSSVDLEPMFEQMDILESLLDRTKTMQVRVKGFEADDVINSYAEWATRHNGEAIIVSSDHDFYQCLRPSVQVFNARDNEMWTEERLEKECGFSRELWLDKGAIEGEVGPSKDNIFGVDGWGKVTAAKYVGEHGDIYAIRDAIESKPEKKRGKREQVYLDQFDRVLLAKSLKKMDSIGDLPMPRVKHRIYEDDIKQMFIEWGFASLMKEAWRFV
jgi:DNA polymerase-1